MGEPQRFLDNFLPQSFGTPTSYVEFTLSQKIKELHPNLQHIVLTDMGFPLASYLQSQDVDVKLTNTHRTYHYFGDKLTKNLKIGLSAFHYRETDFTVYKFSWPDATMGFQTMYNLTFPGAGETDEERNKIGEKLITDAYEWNLGLKEEMWVFTDGHWSKDKKLWKAIQLAGWENLVLDEQFIAGLKRDTETFFSSREIYNSLEIPWKRGLLLLGPPGNGKTESIKVLLKETKHPSLYVKSFATQHGAEAGIRAIFEFARSQAPCLLVLEDLDSMVTPSIRSFFLNELDGLEKNDGILTIATSNHPERIDDSILNRPSRFDVKYTFELPSYELRKVYINKWLIKTRDINGIEFKNELFVREMAEQTDGFSFAFLKELFVSFLLRVAHDKAAGKPSDDPESVMKAQIKQLVAQMEMGEKAKQGTEIGDGAHMSGMSGMPGVPMRMRRALPFTATPMMYGMSSGTSGW